MTLPPVDDALVSPSLATAVLPFAAFAGAALGARFGFWFLQPKEALADDAHWTERARVDYPRKMFASSGGVIAAVMAVVTSYYALGAASPWPPRFVAGAATLASFAGFFVVAGRDERAKKPDPPSWRKLLGATVASWLHFGTGLLALFIALVIAPPVLGLGVAVAIAVGFAFITWVLFGGATPLLSALGVLTPAPQELEEDVAEIAQAVGVSPPRTYVADILQANALVFLIARELVVARPLLDALDRSEMRAVLAHEAGHLGEPSRVAWAHASRVYAVLPLAAAPACYATSPYLGLIPFVVMIFVIELGKRLPRRMEERADAVAKHHEDDEGVYARALEKLHRANLTPAVMPGERAVHPHLYDRLLAAGVQPDYPRPAPPSLRRFRLLIVPFALVVSLPLLPLWVALEIEQNRDDRGAQATLPDRVYRGDANWRAAALDGSMASARSAAARDSSRRPRPSYTAASWDQSGAD